MSSEFFPTHLPTQSHVPQRGAGHSCPGVEMALCLPLLEAAQMGGCTVYPHYEERPQTHIGSFILMLSSPFLSPDQQSSLEVLPSSMVQLLREPWKLSMLG